MAAVLVVTAGTVLAITYTTSKRASLKLNKPNYVATALTKLASNAVGAAFTLETDSTDPNATPLSLQTEVPRSQAPMTVNSEIKVDNLNADKLDGKDSTEIDADKLDGVDSTGYIQGKGNISHRRVSLPLGTIFSEIFEVPGFGEVNGRCYASNPTSYSLEWFNSSGQAQEAWWFNKDGVGYDVVNARTVNLIPFQSTTDYVVVLQVGSQGRTATITAAGHPSSTGCNYSVQAVAQID